MRLQLLCLVTIAALGSSALAQPPGAGGSAGRGGIGSEFAPSRGGPGGLPSASPRDFQRPTPQAGAARLGEFRGAGRPDIGGRRGRPLFDRRPDFARGRQGRPDFAGAERGRPAWAGNREFDAQREIGEPAAERGAMNRGIPPQSRRPQAAEQALQNRLAEIDRMRDRALQENNPRLLDQADRLEQMARQQHARMSGEVAEPGLAEDRFGRGVAEQARVEGRQFGQSVAEQARMLGQNPDGLTGREFGQATAEQARSLGRRPLEPAPDLAPSPDVAAPSGTVEPLPAPN